MKFNFAKIAAAVLMASAMASTCFAQTYPSRLILKTVVTPLHSHDFPGTDAPSVARCLRERV